MSLLFGQATIKADGQTLDTLPGATLDLGGKKRTTVAGATKILGATQEVVPAKLDCEISLKKGYSLETIRGLMDAVIEFRCDSGQTYVIARGWTTDTLTLGDTKVKIVIEGEPAEELV